MSELPLRCIVLDIISWSEAGNGLVEIPWEKIEEKLFGTLEGVEFCVLLTPSQCEMMPAAWKTKYEIVPTEDASIREQVLASYIQKGSLIISSRVVQPYERWLPVRLDPDAPMGMRFAIADGVARYLKNGYVKRLPEIKYPLYSLLTDYAEDAEENPTFSDILALLPLPSSPFELHERIATLCDQKLVVHLDRYLRAKLQELVLFDGMSEEEIDAEIERRRLTMRVRLEWGRQLNVTATASRRELEASRKTTVQNLLGFPLKETQQDDIDAQLRVLPYSDERTTMAYHVDGEIHIINPDPEQEMALRSLPAVHIHKQQSRDLPLRHMLDALSDWTLDHYRQDPQLEQLIATMAQDGIDLRLLKYARAYLGYLGLPTPCPTPGALSDGLSILKKVLQKPLPPATIRYQYPHNGIHASTPKSKKTDGYVIIEAPADSSKKLYSPMSCIATPANAVTLHRNKRYVQVHLSLAMLGYRKEDIFTDSLDFESEPTSHVPKQSAPSTPPPPSTPESLLSFEKDSAKIAELSQKEWYAEYPFRHAGLDQEYVVFPLLQQTGDTVVSYDPNEFLKFFQLNDALRKISDLLSQHSEGRIPALLAEEIAPRVKDLFRPLQREHIYFTFREGTAFQLDVAWEALDRQVGVAWLALRQAIGQAESVALHDGRILLHVASDIYAEIHVRALAPGVNLPFEVHVCTTRETLAMNAQSSGMAAHGMALMQAHPIYQATQAAEHFAVNLPLPLPLQIVGEGVCIDIRFFGSPLLG